ncbi:MAG: TonB family protein [Sporocytophaga sp.]|uniref:TonB family protein n=1 Tax=Sporocytophaga sp. TaxID=2231183 RepID=UPI001B20CF88|nr:TonB family protein [Sporocytophaga sp.]MBO9703144.1 TonB family protein [Sporocytophaga sp.]
MRTAVKALCILILSIVSSEILACNCVETNTVKDEIKNSDAILVGRIIERDPVELYDSIPALKFKLVVDAFYKGQLTNDTVLIFTGANSVACGYEFEKGFKYIIYANNHKVKELNKKQENFAPKNIFYTTNCSRTRLHDMTEIKEIEKHLQNLKYKSEEALITLGNPPVCKNCGKQGVKKFIRDNLNYPRGQCIEGKVYVGFTVDTLGNVKEVNIKRGLTKEADEEAIRIVKMMIFYPGTVDERPIKVKMVLPINFSIEE